MMRLRRHLLPLALLALVLIALPFTAGAQIPMIANGIVTATNASVNSANTTAETLLFQYTLPAAMLASWTTSNAAFASVPLHLKLNGYIQSTTTGAGTLGVNLGGSTATMLVANAMIINSGNTVNPWHLDVWISPIATLTTTSCTDVIGSCNRSIYMSGRMAYGKQSGSSETLASESVSNGLVLGTTAMNQPQTLTVLWRWSAAASANTLNIMNGTLVVGE